MYRLAINLQTLMKISVIVPIYNVEKYLHRCIDSIIAQTYSDIEIILVNDGSPDNSPAICEEYAKTDARIKVIHQKNKGLSGARNTGIKESTGDYIYFIDADDKIEHHAMEQFHNAITKHRPDIVMSNVMQYTLGNLDYNILRNNTPYDRLLSIDEIAKYLIQPYYGGSMANIPHVWTKCYRREFVLGNNMWFDESLKRSEDYWFNFFAFNAAESVLAIDQAFYHYYQNTGSMIRSLRDGQFDAFLKNRLNLISLYNFPQFDINWTGLNNNFVNNINELILMEIKAKGIFKAKSAILGYLKNYELQKAYANSDLAKTHVKLIRKLIARKFYTPAFYIYCIWSLKA